MRKGNVHHFITAKLYITTCPKSQRTRIFFYIFCGPRHKKRINEGRQRNSKVNLYTRTIESEPSRRHAHRQSKRPTPKHDNEEKCANSNHSSGSIGRTLTPTLSSTSRFFNPVCGGAIRFDIAELFSPNFGEAGDVAASTPMARKCWFWKKSGQWGARKR